MLRTGLLSAGAVALVAWGVVSCLAVFFEPGFDDAVDTWLVVGTVAGCMAAGLTLTIMVTHPGWPSAMAGAFVVLGAGAAAWLVYTAIPSPGGEAFIPHRLALAAFGYGFGILGGGMVLAGELLTDGPAPSEARRPGNRPRFRIGVVTAALVAGAALVGTPAVHDWTDAANTDAVTASRAVPRTARLDPAAATMARTPAGGLGTAGGLLTVDQPGDDASAAITMRDIAGGTERWHFRQWNRRLTGDPVTSADGRLVAVPGQRRDDTSRRYVTVLDTRTGERRAELRLSTDPGRLRFVGEEVALFVTGSTADTVSARRFDGSVAWTYRMPQDCALSTVGGSRDAVVLALGCRADTSTKDHARVLSLDAASGERNWLWRAEATGLIPERGLVIGDELVVVDVRRDESARDAMFAARQFRHDLTAVNLADGEQAWRRADLDLGDTYAPACAGTLQLAGTARDTGRVVLGECHQELGRAGATFDVAAYALSDGSGRYHASAPLGYAPTRGVDTGRWFAGLPDGRVVFASDASSDLHRPDCRFYAAGPDSSGQHEDLTVSPELDGSAWCRSAAIQVTPDGLAVTFPATGDEPNEEYFAFD